MLVWKVANDNSTNTKKLRQILIELSGKQIQRGVDFTYPALLKGLENYIITIDILTRFSVDDIFKMKDECWGLRFKCYYLCREVCLYTI